MTILVVDDELDVRDSLQAILSHEGYEVLTARSAIEALRIFDARQVDLMLVDYSMPDMTGEELVDILSHQQRCPPSLFISGLAPWRLAGMALKGIGYIRKPFNNELLLSTIAQMTGKAEHVQA